MATMAVVLFFCIIPVYFVPEPNRHDREESLITSSTNYQGSQISRTHKSNSDI
jgi:hypothetical protein